MNGLIEEVANERAAAWLSEVLYEGEDREPHATAGAPNQSLQLNDLGATLRGRAAERSSVGLTRSEVKVESNASTHPLLILIEHWLEGRQELRLEREELDSFLSATSASSKSPAERLRQLGIRLEADTVGATWPAVQRAYARARELEPENADIAQSWGISAIARMNHPAELSDRIAIAEEALQLLEEANRLAPDDVATAHAIGLLNYEHPAAGEQPEPYRERALQWFSTAVKLDPNHQMARLYLAHCLHDARRWDLAVDAYKAVDEPSLRRNWPRWRSIKLKEQLASCLAFAGRLEESRTAFVEFFNEVERLDEDQLLEEVINLDEAFEALVGPLPEADLVERAKRLARKADETERYPAWFACAETDPKDVAADRAACNRPDASSLGSGTGGQAGRGRRPGS